MSRVAIETFFMPGVAERTFPLIPKVNQDLTAAITRFHEKKFDERQVFTRERFDEDFYVGKGSTYPDFFGCVGILFEQPRLVALNSELPEESSLLQIRSQTSFVRRSPQ